MRSIRVAVEAVLAVAVASTTAFAAPITLQNPINFRDDRSPNPVGVSMGDVDVFGVNSATPLGTTVTATRATSGTLPLFFFPFTILPNSYSRSIPWNGDATAWSLTATNGPDSAIASTPSIPTPRVIPLVLNLQVVGKGLTPTIQWTDPDLTGVTRSFVRV